MTAPDVVVVLVACPECGQPRPVLPHYLTKATRRRCRPCTAEAIRATFLERFADTDEMAVERLISGSPVNSTRGERTAAVEKLTAHHYPAGVVAARLGVTRRTVERHRARLRTH